MTLFVGFSSDSEAQYLYRNEITSSNPSASNPYKSGDITATHITGQGIGRGPGISSNSGSGRYNARNWTTSSSSTDGNDYFYIRFDVDAGYKADITTIYFQTKRSSYGPRRFYIRSSADNYSQNLYYYYTTSTSNRTQTFSVPSNLLKDLTGTVELRFYAYNSTSGSGTFSINYYRIVGTVAAAAPVIDNLNITNIKSDSADASANLAGNGGKTITERGFVWATTNNPEVGDIGATSVLASGTGLGSYSATFAGLPEGSLIYYRAYVKESGGNYYYTTSSSFYSLSKEPTSYPASFTAATQSKNSILLNWTQVADADGYLILQKTYDPSNASPTDASEYSLNQSLGDATVVGKITNNATTSLLVNNLLQGTRFHYTLFPFTWDSNNEPTLNYKSDDPFVRATDSTWGRPTSSTSTILGFGGESLLIPSIQNDIITTNQDGLKVWDLKLSDGGATQLDDDDLPTVLTSLKLTKGAYNTVSSWSNSIENIVLIDDSTNTILANGVVSSSQIVFSGFNVSAADDNYRPLSIRLSLKKKAHIDNQIFQFTINESGITTGDLIISSQKALFTETSDSSKNKVEVLASKLAFVNQPPSQIEAGYLLPNQIQVIARDTFNGIDLDFNAVVNLDASSANLINGPLTDTAQTSISSFDSLMFNQYSMSDTLIAQSTGLIPARSNAFEVYNSSLSDIINDGMFIPESNIVHTNYNQGTSVTLNNSLKVNSYWLRDGGNSEDLDFDSTVVKDLVFEVESAHLIRRAALFSGSTKLQETDSVHEAGALRFIQFEQLGFGAADNDSIEFSLHILFNDSAIDGERLVVTVSSANTMSGKSVFKDADAGGAISSLLNDDNKIDIIAKKLVFLTQPSDVRRGSSMSPAVEVLACDSFNNIDLLQRNVNLSSNGSNLAPVANVTSLSKTDGIVEFDKIIFTQVANGVTITAHSAQLDSAISNLFDVLDPVWFRTMSTGDWSDSSIWESSNDYGQSWTAATEAPNYNDHGQITISTGDTVQMDGTNYVENTIDETIIEYGGYLLTPQTANQKLNINDGIGVDLLVEGGIVHNNGQSQGGIRILDQGRVEVATDGSIELVSYGNALRWAGNPKIDFDSGSYYIHNTDIVGTIGDGVLFPNSDSTDLPIFLLKENAIKPSAQTNPSGQVVINGILEIQSDDTLELGNQVMIDVRDGIKNDGLVLLSDNSKIAISGNEAYLDGNGEILLNDEAVFSIPQGAIVTLRNDHKVNTSDNGRLEVKGIWDAKDKELIGNFELRSFNGSQLISAHATGLDGSFNTTGNKIFDNGTSLFYNGSVAQRSGQLGSGIFKSLILDNNLGLTLDNSLNISDSIVLNDGKIMVSSGNQVNLNLGAEVYNYSSTRFIDGILSRTIVSNDSAYFPVGDGNTFAPIRYYSSANQNDDVAIEYLENTPQSAGYSDANLNDLMSIVGQEYWTIQASNGFVEIPFTANSGNTGKPLQDLRVASWNGAAWDSEGPMARNATSNSIKSDILKNYSVLSIGLDSPCTSPTLPSFTSNEVCENEKVILDASSNGQLNWYTDNFSAAPFATGNLVDMGMLANDSVIYVEAQMNACKSARVAYPITVNQIPSKPQISANNVICYNSSIELKPDSVGIYNWYADLNGSNLLATGSSFTSPTLIKDTVYYVSETVNSCESPIQTVNILTKDSVESPASMTETICGGLPMNWTISHKYDILWFSQMTDTATIYQGKYFTTDTLHTDTAFYAQSITSDGCTSSKAKMEVNVLAQPSSPTATNYEICAGENVELTTSSNGQLIQWYADPSSSSVLDTGIVYTTPNLFVSRDFYASSFNGACYSERTRFSVDVNQLPADFSILTPAVITGGQSTTIQTDAVAQNYEWNFGPDASPQTATGMGPHQVVWNKSGFQMIELKVWNGSTSASCVKTNQKVVNLGIGTGVDLSADASLVQVYPNPSKTVVNISAKNLTGVKYTRVYNSQGQAIHAEYHESDLQLKVAEWTPGIYIVQVEHEGNLYSSKIIVQ